MALLEKEIIRILKNSKKEIHYPSLSLSLSVVGYHFYTHLMMQHQLIDNMCNILSPQKEADSKKKQPQKTEKIKIQTMDTHEKKKSPPHPPPIFFNSSTDTMHQGIIFQYWF